MVATSGRNAPEASAKPAPGGGVVAGADAHDDAVHADAHRLGVHSVAGPKYAGQDGIVPEGRNKKFAVVVTVLFWAAPVHLSSSATDSLIAATASAA